MGIHPFATLHNNCGRISLQLRLSAKNIKQIQGLSSYCAVDYNIQTFVKDAIDYYLAAILDMDEEEANLYAGATIFLHFYQINAPLKQRKKQIIEFIKTSAICDSPDTKIIINRIFFLRPYKFLSENAFFHAFQEIFWDNFRHTKDKEYEEFITKIQQLKLWS